MSGTLKAFAVVSGLAATLFCLAAGLWILTKIGFDRGSDVTSTALGLYFIGKALFVGPMLIVTAFGQNRPAGEAGNR
jgi:hypothetical protein